MFDCEKLLMNFLKVFNEFALTFWSMQQQYIRQLDSQRRLYDPLANQKGKNIL